MTLFGEIPMGVAVMRKRIVCLLAPIMLLTSVPALAVVAWYRGGITRIASMGGNDFLLTFDNGVLSDCQNNYVFFRESILGTAMVKNAYALAMTAKATGMQFGAVIDKAIDGPGGECVQANNMFDAI
jgi:hypothetical protein